jgi:hypothetical protein
LTRAAFAAQLPLLSGAAPKLAGALEKRRPRHSHPEGSQGRVREVAVAHSWQNLVIPRRSPFTELLALSGVNATLRLLFARQAKGKRKLVLAAFFNSNPTFAPSAGTSNLVQSPTVTQMEMFCSFDDWFCQAIARLLDRCGQFQN